MNAKLILMLLGGCMLMTSCPKQPYKRQNLMPVKPAVTSEVVAQPMAPDNLLELTPMSTDHPTNVGISRNGKRFLFNVLNQSPVSQLVVSVDYEDGRLVNAREIHLYNQLAKAFLSMHPAGDRGLTVRNYQNPGQPVIDELVEVQLGRESRVLRHEAAPGIPTDFPPDDKYGIDAIYSWDGDTVAVGLKYSGIVVVDFTGGAPRFVEYPELDYPRTGKSIQAMEDQNGKRRMLVSVWAQDVYKDSCKLYTLDLDSLEYKKIADLNWVAYNVGSPDYDNEPWVVTGSRGRETNQDIKRTPLLFMLDPSGSSAQSTVQFFSEPIWQVEVSTHGDKVVFLDQQREAIVRLTPLTGEVEVARKHYNPTGELLVSADCSEVFIWERDELYKAEFTETESFTPYGED